MANVSFDANGNLTGVYANVQSFSTVIDDNDPRIAALLTPPVSCYLWQIEAVLGPAQWAAVQAAVTAKANPALSAFFAYGTNVIPSNSPTLVGLGAAIGLTPAQVAAIVTEAAAITIV